MREIFICILALTSTTLVFGQAALPKKVEPLSFVTNCKDVKESPEKPLDLERIQEEKDIIDILNRLPAVGSSMDKIQMLLSNFANGGCNCSVEKHELGYGLKSMQYKIYLDYGAYSVDALYFDKHVVKIRLTIDNYQEIIEKYLQQSIKLPYKCLNGEIAYEQIYERNLTKYKSDFGFLFIESSDTISQRNQAINYFTNIFNGGKFQAPYHIPSMLGRETFNYLRYFIVNRDYDALQNLLFCPSPTSRLFAARTLLYMKEKISFIPNGDITKRIDEIMKDAKPISSGILSCWGMRKYHYYDVVKNFETYLITE